MTTTNCSTVPPRQCIDCSTGISDRHFNAKRCLDCQTASERVRGQARHKRKWADISFRDAENARRRERKLERLQDPDYVAHEQKRSREWVNAKRQSDPVFRERINARLRDYYRQVMADPERKKASRGKSREYAREWARRQSANPDYKAAFNARRRMKYASDPDTRKRASMHNRLHGKWDRSVNRQSVAVVFQAQKGKCACCQTNISNGYHLDHIMPRAQGGQSRIDNLQLLCARCNISKGSRLTYYPPDGGQGKMALGV